MLASAANQGNFVSIHAPAWGATSLNNLTLMLRRVSIHAPAWGATEIAKLCALALVVSIHAPAWGATFHNTLDLIRYGVSIHAPAWGATLRIRARDEHEAFQSTLPRGERPCRTKTCD